MRRKKTTVATTAPHGRPRALGGVNIAMPGEEGPTGGRTLGGGARGTAKTGRASGRPHAPGGERGAGNIVRLFTATIRHS